MLPPCFTAASRKLPLGVQAYSCAVTGAPVMSSLSPMRLRGHVRRIYPYPFPPPGALCTASAGLLFPSLPSQKRLTPYYRTRRHLSSFFRRKGRKNLFPAVTVLAPQASQLQWLLQPYLLRCQTAFLLIFSGFPFSHSTPVVFVVVFSG